MKVLWIGPNYAQRYNCHHESLPRAVAKLHEVIRYGHGNPPCEHWGHGLHVPALVNMYRPDIVVIQHPRHCGEYTGIDKVKLPTVAILCDYFPRNYAVKHAFLTKNKIDAAFFPESEMVSIAEDAQRLGKIPLRTRLRWLPFWADTDMFKPLNLEQKWDVMFLCSAGPGQPNRHTIAAVLSSMKPERRVFSRIVRKRADKIIGQDYVNLINSSRIAVTANDVRGSVNFKHFEFPACGTLMFSDMAEDFDALGFKHRAHYVRYRNSRDLPTLINIYLDDPYGLLRNGRARIEYQALELIRARHTVDIRATELCEELCQLF